MIRSLLLSLSIFVGLAMPTHLAANPQLALTPSARANMEVLDATNLKAEDRARVLALLPRGVFARYVVLDRDLDEKIRDRGWRAEELVLKQHRLFRREERNILAGDEHPYVTVQDKRQKR